MGGGGEPHRTDAKILRGLENGDGSEQLGGPDTSSLRVASDTSASYQPPSQPPVRLSLVTGSQNWTRAWSVTEILSRRVSLSAGTRASGRPGVTSLAAARGVTRDTEGEGRGRGGGRTGEGGGRCTEDGGRRVVNGERLSVYGGRWKVDDGRWTVDGGR